MVKASPSKRKAAPTRQERASGPPKSLPVQFASNVQVVAGNLLPKGKLLVLHTLEEQGVAFWPISVGSSEACELLAGKPKCYRPLCKLVVLQRLRLAVIRARASLGEEADADDDVEDLWGDQPESVTPEKVKKDPTGGTELMTPGKLTKGGDGKRDRGGHMRRSPIVSVQMPLDDDNLSAGSIDIKLLNSVKTLAIECTEKALAWLAAAVRKEVEAKSIED